MEKEYLGDGVYAEIVNGMILLTADSDGQTNRIYLEPEVAAALQRYCLRAQGIDPESDRAGSNDTTSAENGSAATLLTRIVESAQSPPDYYNSFRFPQNWREHIESPNFAEAGKVHDWRNYVHWLGIQFWNELDDSSKLLIYLQAEEDASNEIWD